MQTPTANINPETGIPYGVALANNYPDLYETITEKGTNLSYEAWNTQISDKIVMSLIGQYPYTDLREIPELQIIEDSDLYNIVQEYQEQREQHNFRVSDFVNDWIISEHGCEIDSCYSDDEEEYAYVDESFNMFMLRYIGGAAHIWVIKSDRIVSCRECSPCIPNAGDLDSPDDQGMDCYGIPTQYTE